MDQRLKTHKMHGKAAFQTIKTLPVKMHGVKSSPDGEMRRVFLPVSAVVSHTAGCGGPSKPNHGVGCDFNEIADGFCAVAVSLSACSLVNIFVVDKIAQGVPYLCRSSSAGGACLNKAMDAQPVSGSNSFPGRRHELKFWLSICRNRQLRQITEQKILRRCQGAPLQSVVGGRQVRRPGAIAPSDVPACAASSLVIMEKARPGCTHQHRNSNMAARSDGKCEGQLQQRRRGDWHLIEWHRLSQQAR